MLRAVIKDVTLGHFLSGVKLGFPFPRMIVVPKRNNSVWAIKP